MIILVTTHSTRFLTTNQSKKVQLTCFWPLLTITVLMQPTIFFQVSTFCRILSISHRSEIPTLESFFAPGKGQNHFVLICFENLNLKILTDYNLTVVVIHLYRNHCTLPLLLHWFDPSWPNEGCCSQAKWPEKRPRERLLPSNGR